MIVLRDLLRLCTDCTLYACNSDLSGIDSAERCAEVQRGVESLGVNLVANDQEGDEEFSSCPYDACKTRLAGARHYFAILGEF